MKKIIFSIILSVIAIVTFAQTNFRSVSFDEAVAAAKQEKKLVFIDFYTDWCGPCKQMAREVFPQKKVGDYFNANFVCIKLNAEKEGKDLAQRFQVKAYPTFLVLDTNEKVLMDIKGSMSADAFISKVQNELNPDLTPERMKERYESGERTPELINAYAFSYMEKGKEAEGFQIVNDYFNSLSDAQKLAAENFFLFSRYTIKLDDPKAQFMIAHCNEFAEPVRKQAEACMQKLFKSELNTYLSGYKFTNEDFDKAAYQRLKDEIIRLELDKQYAYAPIFEMIECYAEGDKSAYLDLLEARKSVLDKQDFELVLLNLSRLVPASEGLNARMAASIRAALPELRPLAIMMMGRLLSELEAPTK